MRFVAWIGWSVPRSEDPLATFLYLIARNYITWGQVEAAISKAFSDATPPLPADDPVAMWATQQAATLRNP